jgi:hypothetical protein
MAPRTSRYCQPQPRCSALLTPTPTPRREQHHPEAGPQRRWDRLVRDLPRLPEVLSLSRAGLIPTPFQPHSHPILDPFSPHSHPILVLHRGHGAGGSKGGSTRTLRHQGAIGGVSAAAGGFHGVASAPQGSQDPYGAVIGHIGSSTDHRHTFAFEFAFLHMAPRARVTPVRA